MSNVLPGASSTYEFLFHKLCENIFFFKLEISPRLALRDLVSLSLSYFSSSLRPPRRLLGLRPLAKRRTYWLS